MSKSEKRIRDNRIRRQHERRRNIFITLLTACLIITLSVAANSFLSNAQTDNKETVFKYYKSILIESGDTLWSIASEYKSPDMDTTTFLEEIKRMNGLANDNIIMGNYLIVPYYSSEFHSSF